MWAEFLYDWKQTTNCCKSFDGKLLQDCILLSQIYFKKKKSCSVKRIQNKEEYLKFNLKLRQTAEKQKLIAKEIKKKWRTKKIRVKNSLKKIIF